MLMEWEFRQKRLSEETRELGQQRKKEERLSRRNAFDALDPYPIQAINLSVMEREQPLPINN